MTHKRSKGSHHGRVAHRQLNSQRLLMGAMALAIVTTAVWFGIRAGGPREPDQANGTTTRQAQTATDSKRAASAPVFGGEVAVSNPSAVPNPAASSSSQNEQRDGLAAQEARVRNLVSRNLALSSRRDVDGLTKLFVNSVDFYGNPGFSRAAIRQDKSRFFSRWTDVSYAMESVPRVRIDVSGEKLRVTFMYHFHVSRPSSTRSGLAEKSMTLERYGTDLLITDISETIVRRD